MANLIGEYSHQLDAKYRFRIPAKLRKALGDGFIFARGSDNCVFVFSKEQADKELNRLAKISIYDRKRQKSVRNFARGFEEAKEDSQGRIILSPELRKHLKMDKEDRELFICGAINRVEIWSKKEHDKYFHCADCEDGEEESDEESLSFDDMLEMLCGDEE